MVVLIAIYTFQFEDFPGYWGNFTGFTEQQYVPWFTIYYLQVFRMKYERNVLNVIPNPCSFMFLWNTKGEVYLKVPAALFNTIKLNE